MKWMRARSWVHRNSGCLLPHLAEIVIRGSTGCRRCIRGCSEKRNQREPVAVGQGRIQCTHRRANLVQRVHDAAWQLRVPVRPVSNVADTSHVPPHAVEWVPGSSATPSAGSGTDALGRRVDQSHTRIAALLQARQSRSARPRSLTRASTTTGNKFRRRPLQLVLARRTPLALTPVPWGT